MPNKPTTPNDMNQRDKDLQPQPYNPEREKLFVDVSPTTLREWETEFDSLQLPDDLRYSRPIVKNFIQNILTSHNTELLQKIEKFIDENYLSYCREQNGLPYCKNCGLDLGEIKSIINQYK